MKGLILVLVAASMPSWAYAQQTLSASEIKTLIVGRTIESTVHDRNLRFKNYYSADGSVLGFNVSRGTQFEGQWSINDSGQLCTNFRVQGHLCTNIVRMDDGSHKRMDGTKAITTFHQISDGNTIK